MCLRDPGPLSGLREATLPLPWDAEREAMFGPHHGSPGSLCPVMCPPDLHTLFFSKAQGIEHWKVHQNGAGRNQQKYELAELKVP